MLSLQHLCLSFSGKVLLDDLNLTINATDKIGLIGRNGSGKSTLLKCLTGQLEPDLGHIKKPPQFRIGYLQQHMHFQKETVLEEVCLALPEERFWEEWRAEKMLLSLGFQEEDLIEPPASFSGGWQVKMQLAKLLLAQPDLLLLDEPTNYLDIISIRWLKDMLQTWPGSFILITHDRMFLDSVINHTLVIHRKRAHKHSGTSAKLLTKIAQQDLVHEQRRVNEEKKQQQTLAWIQKFKAKASMATRVQSKIKALDKQEQLEKLEEVSTLAFQFPSAPFLSKEPLIKAQNLHFSYPNSEHSLISRFSFQLEPGEKIGIIGRNGKGKSTLLKLLHQTLPPQKGAVSTHSKVQKGFFGQMNIAQLDETQTIYQALSESAEGLSETHIRSVCGQMLFCGDDADKRIAKLSGGEKSRVVLGKILLTHTNCLLLDEPTNHLDMESCDALCAALSQFQGAVVLVTHDEGLLKKLCTRLLVFQNGTIEEFRGPYSDFLDKHGWSEEQGTL